VPPRSSITREEEIGQQYTATLKKHTIMLLYVTLKQVRWRLFLSVVVVGGVVVAAAAGVTGDAVRWGLNVCALWVARR
jgi:hypothetical protein